MLYKAEASSLDVVSRDVLDLAERMWLICDQQEWTKEELNYKSLKNGLYFGSV